MFILKLYLKSKVAHKLFLHNTDPCYVPNYDRAYQILKKSVKSCITALPKLN